MSDDPDLAAARQTVKAAQRKFEQESEAAHRGRREAFAEAQKAGLSLREIAEEVGLHYTRVGEIIRGK